jgi:hypothetical protein
MDLYEVVAHKQTAILAVVVRATSRDHAIRLARPLLHALKPTDAPLRNIRVLKG